jgi:hypothetical protein
MNEEMRVTSRKWLWSISKYSLGVVLKRQTETSRKRVRPYDWGKATAGLEDCTAGRGRDFSIPRSTWVWDQSCVVYGRNVGLFPGGREAKCPKRETDHTKDLYVPS